MTPEEAKATSWNLVNQFMVMAESSDAQCDRAAQLVDWFASALLSAAGGWNADMDAAPRDRPVLLYDDRLQRCVVAEWMTAIDDGAQDWVFARQHGLAGIAFVSRDATHWRELPAPPALRLSKSPE